MQSFLVSALIASGTILSMANGQTYPPANVSSIDPSVRAQWCVAQTTSCKNLCEDQNLLVTENECYPDNLFYKCTCSNGRSPNVTEYSQTIPYFTCTLEVQGCVDNCKGESSCGDACTANKKCGATNPKPVNATTTTTASASKKPSATSSGDGFDVTGTDSSKPSNAAGFFIEAGSVYGMGVFIAGVVAGLAMVGI